MDSLSLDKRRLWQKKDVLGQGNLICEEELFLEKKNIACKKAMKFFAGKFYCHDLRSLLAGAGLAPAQS